MSNPTTLAAAAWAQAARSSAIGQRSMGDPTRLFPLFPPLLEGCPATSTAAMQYPLEIDYDYARVPAELLRQPPLAGLERWAPLLPPVKPGLSLGEGGTPLLAAERIGDWIGLDGPLWLKDESQNPTWSHKDRLNYCVVSAALAVGAPGIAVASSGNHGAAAAAYAARAGLPCVVVTSPAAQPAFRQLLDALGAFVAIVPTERRWALLKRIVAETGFMPASNLTPFPTGNPYGPEGYKTIAYEIFAQLGEMPGTVVAPTCYG
jgi:threonine synthase